MNKVDISFIQPEASTLTIDGKDITVSPITMRALPALVRAVQPILADVMRLSAAPSFEGALSLIGLNGSAACEAVALCSGADIDDILALTPDRAAALLLVCCEVNTDFFVRAVPSLKSDMGKAAPRISAQLDALISANPGARSTGLMPS